MPVNDVTSAKKFVKDWMDHRKVFDIEIDPTPGNLYFQFAGKSEGGIGFSVMQPRIWDTSVLIMAEVTISEQHSKILESMRQTDRKEFIFNLQKDLIFGPASFALDPTFKTRGYPQGIQLSREICYDNLTEDRLSNSMRDVASSVVYIIELFKNELGEAGV